MALVFFDMYTRTQYKPLEWHWTSRPRRDGIGLAYDDGKRSEANVALWCAHWNDLAEQRGDPEHYILIDDAEPMPDHYTPSLF